MLLAYAAGVILSFAALGGALLMLRAGGSAIGWGFQLQSPVVVGLLAYLLFAMGLSLSGVADFGFGLAGVGGRFAGREGLGGAFATGVLATIVATPCTAPFMGAALGFALLAPAPLALAIFLALGIGLAAPLAIATLIPGFARLLPRPGRWMVLLKQLLAFPLYGTVAWLVWVLIQEVGPEGALMALFGLVLVGFAVWVYGTTRLAGAGDAPRRHRARRGGNGSRAPARAHRNALPRAARTDGQPGRAAIRAVQPGAPRCADSRASARLCQSDRGLVHHLSRQRARDARYGSGAAGLRRASDRCAEGRLDAAGSRDHRLAAEIWAQRRAALFALRPLRHGERPAADPDPVGSLDAIGKI